MADTQRTVAEVLAFLADNVSREISPQDVRDAFVTWRKYRGQLSVTSGATVTITNDTDYFEATAPTWQLNEALLFDQSAGSGRLTYVGVAEVVAHVVATVSMELTGNNKTIHWRVGKNTASDPASEIIHKIGPGSDVVSSALMLILTLSPGDYVSLWVRNQDDNADVIVQAGSMKVVTFPA